MDDSAPRFGRTLLGTRSVFDEIVIRHSVGISVGTLST